MSDGQYSFLDKTLHRMALNFPSVAELSFDLDQNFSNKIIENAKDEKHIFVSGLARAGTTILMRKLHDTGHFRSLTYKDMPFVLAPNLWAKITSGANSKTHKHERMHGDGLMVDTDSPEALEEVFWRVFIGDDYIRKNQLVSHTVTKDIIDKFRNYVAAIVSGNALASNRYLSKNNNNILRLPSIRKAFPNALILIPFRDPLTHSHSLLQQHRHFCDLHKKDKFTKSYMKWLVHHEFGSDHRPFSFGSHSPNPYDPSTLNYWLQTWINTYDALLKTAPKDCWFVCYDGLCTDPHVWQAILEKAGVQETPNTKSIFTLSEAQSQTNAEPGLGAQARALYTRMKDRFQA